MTTPLYDGISALIIKFLDIIAQFDSDERRQPILLGLHKRQLISHNVQLHWLFVGRG